MTRLQIPHLISDDGYDGVSTPPKPLHPRVMDAALIASSSSSSIVAQRSLLLQSPQSHRFSSWRLAFNSSLKNLPNERGSRRGLVVAGAKKKKNKVDSHSFSPSPEEATGPFPEAVLLKKVQCLNDIIGVACKL